MLFKLFFKFASYTSTVSHPLQLIFEIVSLSLFMRGKALSYDSFSSLYKLKILVWHGTGTPEG